MPAQRFQYPFRLFPSTVFLEVICPTTAQLHPSAFQEVSDEDDLHTRAGSCICLGGGGGGGGGGGACMLRSGKMHSESCHKVKKSKVLKIHRMKQTVNSYLNTSSLHWRSAASHLQRQ